MKDVFSHNDYVKNNRQTSRSVKQKSILIMMFHKHSIFLLLVWFLNTTCYNDLNSSMERVPPFDYKSHCGFCSSDLGKFLSSQAVGPMNFFQVS